jgi:hypothetical protein
MIDQRASQRLHLLIQHDGHLDPPRILQTRGEEVNPSSGAVEKLDDDLAEVVLGEFLMESFP